MDGALHKKYTGSGNKRIIGNLKKLVDAKAEVVVRTPEIPGVNDSPEEKQKLAALLAELGGLKHEGLPYHRLGENKYESLGLVKPKDFTSDSRQ
jgi:pyruvate formate lyase activating enzyme